MIGKLHDHPGRLPTARHGGQVCLAIAVDATTFVVFVASCLASFVPNSETKILRTDLVFHPGCDGLHIHRQAYIHTQTHLAIETGGSEWVPIHTAEQHVTTIELTDVELSPLS